MLLTESETGLATQRRRDEAGGAADESLILVVEDDNVSALALTRFLAREGFGVLRAANGAAGRALARERQPDLILLDLRMPGEDGFTTCESLKRDSLTAGIPVIFLSASQDTDSKVRALELGGVDFIHKPFEPAEVLARVRVHLKLSLAFRQLVELQAAQLQRLTQAQQAILTRPEALPEATFSVCYRPAQVVGGDFYDVLRVSQDRFAYAVVDISGHDLGSSLPTAAVKALLRQNTGAVYSPLDTLQAINAVMRGILAEDQYLTMAYALLDRARGVLRVSHAAHPASLLLRADGSVEELVSTGELLGLFDTVAVDTLTVPVQRGERLFLYTDGLTERFGRVRQTRSAGLARLSAAVAASRALPLEAAVEGIVAELFGGDTPDDDVLLLATEV